MLHIATSFILIQQPLVKDHVLKMSQLNICVSKLKYIRMIKANVNDHHFYYNDFIMKALL